MSTAVATQHHYNSFGLEGFEDLGQSDIILPRWSIVQSNSRADNAVKHIGQFVRNIDGEFRETLDVVILKASPNRLLWEGDPGEGFRADRRPECVSRDGVNGSVYGACAVCQFNIQANPALREERNAKKCNFGYSLVIVDDIDQQTMALFGAMGMSVRAVKTLVTQFVQRKRPAFSALVNLGTVQTANEKGTFYVIKPTITRWFGEDETAAWRDLHGSVAGAVIREYDEADDAGDDAPPPF